MATNMQKLHKSITIMGFADDVGIIYIIINSCNRHADGFYWLHEKGITIEIADFNYLYNLVHNR